MPGLFRRLTTLVSELRRRKVLRVAGLYLVAAWLLIQVVATVFPLLLVPEWVTRAVVVLTVLGLPLAVSLAWALDWTDQGELRPEGPGPDGEAGGTVGIAGRAVLVGVVLAATGLLGWSAWTVWLGPETTSGPTADRDALDPARVAVLYFDDFSAGGELGYLADGLTEALIHELAQIEPLSVVSRNGVKPFRDPEVSVDSVARILQAGSLVEGSVERRGDHLSATIQLVDGGTGLHHMSRRIEAGGGDPLELRDAIVADAVRLLAQHLGRDLQLAEDRTETTSGPAWESLQRARARVEAADTLRWHLGDVEAARSSLEAADELALRAVEHDPGWARARVFRAWIASALARLEGVSQTSYDTGLIRRGIGYADEALEIEPGLPEALAARGTLRFDLHWSAGTGETEGMLARAEEDLRASVEADPGNVLGWVGLAQLLRTRGDFARAATAAREAVAADPFLIHAEKRILFTMAHVWLELEELERASEWADQGRRRFPAEPTFAGEKLVILAGWPGADAAVDSAWALLEAVEEGYGIPSWPYGQLQVAAVLAREGLADSARAVIRRVREARPDDPWVAYYEANARIRLGEEAEAITLLERFLTELPHRREYIARDWWWRPLRDDARFAALVRTGAD